MTKEEIINYLINEIVENPEKVILFFEENHIEIEAVQE